MIIRKVFNSLESFVVTQLSKLFGRKVGIAKKTCCFTKKVTDAKSYFSAEGKSQFEKSDWKFKSENVISRA